MEEGREREKEKEDWREGRTEEEEGIEAITD